MSIYIGNDLEDRLEALEAENASLRKYNEYHQVIHEIDYMSDLHLDSSFYRQSMKLDNYVKINKWIDFSIGQSTVLQELNKKRPKLSNSDQTQNRRRYVNFENGSHFICSFKAWFPFGLFVPFVARLGFFLPVLVFPALMSVVAFCCSS